MRRILTSVVLATSVSSVNAALIDRGNGLIYDTALDITWLQDANYAMTSGYDIDGKMSFVEVESWLSALNINGVTGWRLPNAIQPDSSCSDQYQAMGYNCTGSDMGNMFYNVLGGAAGNSITSTHNSNFLFFTNIQSDYYWTATWTPTSNNPDLVYDFNFNVGVQGDANKSYSLYAWAVHDGDVGAAVVPIPSAILLFSSGLLGLIRLSRK